MNPDLDKLQPYPFEKLKALLGDVTPTTNLKHIPLSIGEPKHASPQLVIDSLTASLQKLSNYPTTKGIPELREDIANWTHNRFNLYSSSE
jgi:N-succinyldiaminopimelate aminotransferase